MRITVICVGKIKEKFYTDALAEYRKRLSKYCKLEIVELADEKTKENASAHEIELVKAKEGERILSAIKEDMYVIALAIEGKMLDSVELSEKIEKLGLSGSSHVAFVIGGSLGLDSRVLNRAFFKNDFSPPADAGNSFRTDLSCVPDYDGSAVS